MQRFALSQPVGERIAPGALPSPPCSCHRSSGLSQGFWEPVAPPSEAEAAGGGAIRSRCLRQPPPAQQQRAEHLDLLSVLGALQRVNGVMVLKMGVLNTGQETYQFQRV